MKNEILFLVLGALATGCANAQLQQLLDENRALRARLDGLEAEAHQSDYANARENAEAERAQQAAQHPPPAGQQMNARASNVMQPMIVPQPAMPVTAATMGSSVDRNHPSVYHLRLRPGPGVGMVLTVDGGINIPIDGGAYALLDSNGRRVYVVPGVEPGMQAERRDIYFSVVAPGEHRLTVRCIVLPPPSAIAAGYLPVTRSVGRPHSFRVDPPNDWLGSVDSEVCM